MRLDKRLVLVWFGFLSSVSFVSAGSFFASAPVSFSLGFDVCSASSVVDLVGSVVCSVVADFSVECFVVDFVFG